MNVPIQEGGEELLPYFLAGGIEVPPPGTVPGPVVVTTATTIAASPTGAHPGSTSGASNGTANTTNCHRCGRANHWGVDLNRCYWCGDTLCSTCSNAPPMKMGEVEPHYCLQCGRRRTACVYREGKRFCVMCGRRNPVTTLSPELRPGTAPPEGLQRMKCSYLFTLLPDICLIRILDCIGTLEGVMAAGLVNHRMHALSRENSVWWSLTKIRWPDMDICERLLNDTWMVWLVYYRNRHEHYMRSARHPTPIEDSDALHCPLSFNDVDGVTAQGRVFETKICPGCTELLIKCRSSDQAAVLAEHGVIRPTARTGENKNIAAMAVPFALHARDGSPAALAALDWGFSAWYFGAISRSTAEDAMAGAAVGTFLVRESMMRPAEYIVSVTVSGGTVQHIRIIRDQSGYRLGIAGRFTSVPELVRYYNAHSLEEEFPEVRTALVAAPAHQDVAAFLLLRLSDRGSPAAKAAQSAAIRLQEHERQSESQHKAYIQASRVRRETLLGLCRAALTSLELKMSGDGDARLPEGIVTQLIEAGIASSDAELTTLFSGENFDVHSYVETALREVPRPGPRQASGALSTPTLAAPTRRPADAERAGVGPGNAAPLARAGSAANSGAGAAPAADDLDADGGAPGSAINEL